MTHRIALGSLFGSLLVSLGAVPCEAQFSSDIPGVPRAAISLRGGHQVRTEWALTGYRIPSGAPAGGDSTAGGIRVGWGISYRIRSQFELGYDFTLVDAYAVQPPTVASTTPGLAAPAAVSNLYLRGLTAYGIRVGAKYRPIVSVNRDGTRYEIAFGASLQPQLKPLYGVEHLGDSLRQGGQFYHDTASRASAVFKTNPFTDLSSTTQFAAMASYRSRRLTADAAVVAEKVGDRTSVGGTSPIMDYDGIAVHAGGTYRLTQYLAVGGVYWGLGAPPWRDEVRFAPGTAKSDEYAALIQFGSQPESGVDLMYTTPTGSWAQSGRLYLRFRSTR